MLPFLDGQHPAVIAARHVAPLIEVPNHVIHQKHTLGVRQLLQVVPLEVDESDLDLLEEELGVLEGDVLMAGQVHPHYGLTELTEGRQVIQQDLLHLGGIKNKKPYMYGLYYGK